MIIGRLQTRSWDDKDNITRYITEVIAENLMMVGSKNNNQETYRKEPADMEAKADNSVDNQLSTGENQTVEEPPAPGEDDLAF